jgi:hypothetical protein
MACSAIVPETLRDFRKLHPRLRFSDAVFALEIDPLDTIYCTEGHSCGEFSFWYRSTSGVRVDSQLFIDKAFEIEIASLGPTCSLIAETFDLHTD